MFANLIRPERTAELQSNTRVGRIISSDRTVSIDRPERYARIDIKEPNE